jgi:hypothetical protein
MGGEPVAAGELSMGKKKAAEVVTKPTKAEQDLPLVNIQDVLFKEVFGHCRIADPSVDPKARHLDLIFP